MASMIGVALLSTAACTKLATDEFGEIHKRLSRPLKSDDFLELPAYIRSYECTSMDGPECMLMSDARDEIQQQIDNERNRIAEMDISILPLARQLAANSDTDLLALDDVLVSLFGLTMAEMEYIAESEMNPLPTKTQSNDFAQDQSIQNSVGTIKHNGIVQKENIARPTQSDNNQAENTFSLIPFEHQKTSETQFDETSYRSFMANLFKEYLIRRQFIRGLFNYHFCKMIIALCQSESPKSKGDTQSIHKEWCAIRCRNMEIEDKIRNNGIQ